MKIANTHASCVRPEWVDYNGHMRDAFYALVFSHAVDALMVRIGIDEAYRERTSGTLYVLEWHMYFLREVKEGAPLLIENRILDHDAKRFHLHQMMYSGEVLSSVCESMQLHVSQAGEPRAASMPDNIQNLLETLRVPADEINRVQYRSRPIGMTRQH